MKVWIATMAAFASHLHLAAMDQTTAQIQELRQEIAEAPGSPALAAFNPPSEPAAGGWRTRYPRPDPDELELDLSISELVDLEKKLSPAPPRIPTYDLLRLETEPLIAQPGWIPTEGVLVGPGISFGLGFPIQFLGGSAAPGVGHRGQER